MRSKILVLTLLAAMLLVSPFQAMAQAQTPPGVQVTADRVTFSFADLRSTDISLLSPLSISRLLFSFPSNWQLTGGAFELQYDVLLTGSDIARIQNGGGVFGGNLFVKLNNVIVATIPINASGSYVQKITLPAQAMTPTREDGRHMVTFTFDSQVSCVYDISAIVTLKSASFFDLGYSSTSPSLNLARLPAPFFLENSLVPDGARVVVPDQPDAAELQAAMNVMSGFGAMIANTYDLKLVSLGSLSEADRANFHLIFVGRPEQFTLLNDVAFKLPVKDGKFVDLPEKSAEDGILEMALSPWNANKAILLVSGTNTQAVLKAAYAFSSARVLVFEDPVLSYVSNVQLLTQDLPAVEDFTLADLGYTTANDGLLSGVGVNSREFTFFAAKNQVSSREGYIDLIYYHSGMFDYGTSSFSLYLNGEVFSTIVFTKDSEQVTDLRVRIPPGLLRYGENRLEVRANMLQLPSCDQNLSFDPWLTVSDRTSIHLPVSEGVDVTTQALRDLKYYPGLFSTSSDLGDVALVVPSNNPDKWTLAGTLAYNLGATVQPVLSNLTVAFGEDVPEAIRNSYSMIVVGKASELPFLSALNDQLPAPFDPATNTASERQLQISYRIPPGQNVGYLELLPSPYNTGKTILVVSGNTDTGTAIAANALLQGTLKDQLAGVFAVTNGSQVASGSGLSPFSIVGQVVPGSEQVVNPLPAETPSLLTPPAWLVPFMIATGVIILLVIVFVLIRAMEKNRIRRLTGRQSAADEEEGEDEEQDQDQDKKS